MSISGESCLSICTIADRVFSEDGCLSVYDDYSVLEVSEAIVVFTENVSIVWKIMVPMALPAIIAFGIFSVVGHWNSLFWPLIAVRDQNLMPPPLGIMAFNVS